MRYAVGYPVWQKADMLAWYMEGIHTNLFRASLHRGNCPVTVIFCFADCQDDSLQQFNRYSKAILRDAIFRVLPPIILAPQPGQRWITESTQHNALIDAFMADGHADALIVPQDDMKFGGNEFSTIECRRPILDHIDKLFEKFGNKLGCVTGRDAYFKFFSEAAGSWWSPSKLKYRLMPGEFKQGYVVNRGPIIYPRHLVEAIGKLDTAYYKTAFHETDFAARAHHAGFINGAMGMDIVHTLFGRCPTPDASYRLTAEDDILLHRRYPDA